MRYLPNWTKLAVLIIYLNFLSACILPGFNTAISEVEPEATQAEAEVPPEIAQAGAVRQWAISAEASTSYDDPDWAATQATGAPDTTRCGDIQTAWASSGSDSIDWLELEYATPVYVTAVNIHQTFNPNQVTKVELITPLGVARTIYEGNPFHVDQPCPYVLSITVDKTSSRYNIVRLTVDQSTLGLGWNEIDSVELVGDSERTE